jgi:hypothetical protein
MSALSIRRDRTPTVLRKLVKTERCARGTAHFGDRQRARWHEPRGGDALGGRGPPNSARLGDPLQRACWRNRPRCRAAGCRHYRNGRCDEQDAPTLGRLHRPLQDLPGHNRGTAEGIPQTLGVGASVLGFASVRRVQTTPRAAPAPPAGRARECSCCHKLLPAPIRPPLAQPVILPGWPSPDLRLPSLIVPISWRASETRWRPCRFCSSVASKHTPPSAHADDRAEPVLIPSALDQSENIDAVYLATMR